MTARPPTFLRGARLSWAEAPAEVRAWAANLVGGTVTGFSDRVGGMSTGLATVVHGPAGSIFVKGVDGATNPQGHRMCLDEAERVARIGPLPHVPPLLGHADLSPAESPADSGWAVLAFPALSGDPVPHPWRAATLDRVLAAWQPVAQRLAQLAWTEAAHLDLFFTGWREIAARADDPWHDLAQRWTAREERLGADVGGTTADPPVLSHIDLRADNIVVTDDDVWFVDWAHPASAARWVDVAVLLCDVVASGGDVGDGGDIDVLGVWARDEVTGAYDPRTLVDTVGCLAGVLHAHSRRPPHPALPHQRAWEQVMAERMLPFVLRHG